MSTEESGDVFAQLTKPVAAEMAERAERSMQLALYFAHHVVADSVVRERFDSMMASTDARQPMYEFAMSLRYVEAAARLQLKNSARSGTAVRYATRSLSERYGFSQEEIDEVLRRKMAEEAASGAFHGPGELNA